MNNKQRKEAAVDKLRSLMEKDIHQDRPWTCVIVYIRDFWERFYDEAPARASGKPRNLRELGFSKAHYPDQWDADYGVELAVDKALHKLAKQIMQEEDNE